MTYGCQEGFSNKSSTRIQLPRVSDSPSIPSRSTYEEFHFRDLLVHLFHELDDEIHQLMFQHSLCVEVGDEERDIVPLDARQ